MEAKRAAYIIQTKIGAFRYWMGKDSGYCSPKIWHGLKDNAAKFKTKEAATTYAEDFSDRECEIIKEYYE